MLELLLQQQLEKELPPQITYEEPGTCQFIVLPGVTSICAVCVGSGGPGAVRIIWGEGCFFPNTNTQDM